MRTTSLITFAQFEQMPEAPGKQELIDGELIEMPPARLRHINVSKRVYAQLCSGVGEDLAYYETGYRIGGGSVKHSSYHFRQVILHWIRWSWIIIFI